MSKRIFSVMAIASLFLALASCNKSTSTNGGSETEGNWVKMAAFGGNGRAFAVSFVIGNYAYVGTGNTASTTVRQYKDFWKYDVSDGALGSWTIAASMPDTGRYMASAFAIDSLGYVGTGYVNTTGQYTNTFYSFSPATNSWTQKASFPGAARGEAVGFALKGKGYIGTGYDQNLGNIYGDFWEYNPSGDSWVQIANYPGDKRYGAVAFTSGDTAAFVVTGYTGNGDSHDLFSYDGSSWHQKINIYNDNSDETYDDDYSDIIRDRAVAFVLGDYAILATGTSSMGSTTVKTWAYHIAVDRWERRTPYQRTGRYGAVGFTVNGTGLVGTGASSTTSTGIYYNFSKFDPNNSYDSNSDVN